MNSKAIGIVGLGVMGRNLALNLARRGLYVPAYDRNSSALDGKASELKEVMHGGTAGEKAGIYPCSNLAELVAALERPRAILLMTPAGNALEEALAELCPLLERDDIVIDGGNSRFQDTERRAGALRQQGLRFLGMGISGGERGALLGPSLMPGGCRSAYDELESVLQAIAARADDGAPCVAYMGPGGAGHFVKMIHNGIEYAVMQLIAEIADLLAKALGLGPAELGRIFTEWNEGELSSYLIEITGDVLQRTDERTGKPLTEVILDRAEQKGTGRWICQTALDLGVSVPTLSAAVEARFLSALKEERVRASGILTGPQGEAARGDALGGEAPGGEATRGEAARGEAPRGEAPRGEAPRGEATRGEATQGDASRNAGLVAAARDALHASVICAHAQGLHLLALGSAEYGYDLVPARIARIWRAGCIIRSRILNDIASAFEREADLANLMTAPAVARTLVALQANWRRALATAVELGASAPALAASLAYFDAYRTARLSSAALIQAQRDFFGRHGFERTDRPGTFHLT